MKNSKREGQSLIELTLVLPLLLTLLCAVIEFGFYFQALVNVNDASRLGVGVGLAGSVSGSDAMVTSVVSSALGNLAPGSTISIYEYSAAAVASAAPALPSGPGITPRNRTVGNVLVVDVSVSYPCFTGLVNLQTLGGISRIQDTSALVIGN